ncbi:glutamine--fructose-6-phosphate transaminase (isomerizing) [Planctomyces sp. SH-PL62]|uniref:glutamine--fructose-6-phosphate transaminase (isomerizing) n=1 Tax=Planctomyces sp. SH-PL62 TaxID=1636152 RepID=UPI00078E522C|nr:glutamine--fructose-6-phosphate transaminase (isomerizing) [Planctomyces sp. SH-PL62]AMV36769.1 Glutamine--fructose-6-phosphate aminotransferase [Planctomyces sp. SH-PL62]
MCGIVGYTGTREAGPILVAGLRRLEYRGYDSAGLAAVEGGRLEVRKQAGRVSVLEDLLRRQPLKAANGVSHTRWATHGPATDANAHPHVGGRAGRRSVAVVHNGVIENHAELRRELEAEGFVFTGQTDTEVVAHLMARELERGDDPMAALLRVLPRLEGTYGLAIVTADRPGELLGARLGSPLVVGVGDGEHLLASDPVAVVPHTSNVAYLQDGEVVRLTPDVFEIRHRDRGPITPRIDRIDWKPDAVELGGHAHYMLKEIREQPDTVLNACRGRIVPAEGSARLGGLNLTARQLRRVRRVVFAACGTSWHAALVGEYLIERLAHLPVEVEYASEFRYRNAPLDDRTLVFVLSQSGETADTLGALREARRRGHPTLGIVNTVGSTIARETDGGVYLHAGPEVGVASTKAFSAQVAVLTLLALHLGRLRQLSFAEGAAIVAALESVPDLIDEALGAEPLIEAAAEDFVHARSALFLGRDIHYPVALEGALKLKEISYIHAEGYPTAEMKHGPIALIDPHTPSVFVAPRGPLHAKTLSNIEEVRARRGPVVSVGVKGDAELARLSEHVLPIPDAPEVVQPLLAVVPLQLLAYHVARLKGCDIDKPRNLAKSVTVE